MSWSFRSALVALFFLCTLSVMAATSAELALIRSQIDSARNSINELHAMGADPAMIAPLEAQVRYLEEQYRRLAAGQSTTAYNGPVYGAPTPGGSNTAPSVNPGAGGQAAAAQAAIANSNPWANYNPVGPNGQNCTPYYDANLNRTLVPGGCPMPGASRAPSAANPSAPMVSAVPSHPVTPLPRPATAIPGISGNFDTTMPKCSKGSAIPCLRKDGTVKTKPGTGNAAAPPWSKASREAKDKGKKKANGKGKKKGNADDDAADDEVP